MCLNPPVTTVTVTHAEQHTLEVGRSSVLTHFGRTIRPKDSAQLGNVVPFGQSSVLFGLVLYARTASYIQWGNNGVGKVQGVPECKGSPSAKQKKIITVKCIGITIHTVECFVAALQQHTPINVSLNLNSTDVKLVNQNDTPTCTKFGQSILRKIFIIVATRCHLLRLKCTKFDFGWGCTPDPTGGAYSAPTDSLAGFQGAYI